MKICFFFLFTFTLLCNTLFGQQLPTIIPPSPNTAGLGRYGEVPVGLFTGTPKIDIPLFELKTNNLSLPITLNYSSNGVRVDEYSSNVGMGWNLYAGGVITRQINDDPDENPQINVPDTDSELYTDEMVSYLEQYSFDNGRVTSLDSQPDIYTFNFGGHNGRFYLDNNSTMITERTPVFLDPVSLKIEILSRGRRILDGFVITNSKGVKYKFTIKEASKNNSSCDQGINIGWYHRPIKAWHLTSIEHPSGDKINFLYETKIINYANGVSQSVTRESDFNSLSCSQPSDRPCLSFSSTFTPYLKEIVSTTNRIINNKLVFRYSQKDGMPINMNKLDKLSFFDANNILIKEYSFKYKTYTNGGASLLISPFLKEDYHGKRIFLKELTDNNNSRPSYKFEYYQPEYLPVRFSGSQDYWGYFNGRSNSNLIDYKSINKLASGGILNNTFSNFKGSNREPSHINGRNGLLKKIVYPTGGYNNFYYEPHTYLGKEKVYPPLTVQSALATKLNGNIENTQDYFTTKRSAFTQYASLFPVLNINSNGIPLEIEDGEQPISPEYIAFSCRISDLDTGEDVNMYQKINNEYHSLGTSVFSFTNDNIAFTFKKYFLKMEEGHAYKVQIKVIRNNISAKLRLEYYASKPSLDYKNFEVGGLRIAKIETVDNNGNSQNKIYHYSDLNDLTKSSGKLVNSNSAPSVFNNVSVSVSTKETGYGNFIAGSCSTVTISSNSAYPIYDKYHIGYTTIIEENGDNFYGGGTKTVFQTHQTGFEPNLSFVGGNVPGTPLSNSFGYGRELEKVIFKKIGEKFVILNKVKNIYKHDLRLDKEIKAVNVRQRVKINGGPIAIPSSPVLRVGAFDITNYKVKRQWHYLEKTINTDYDQNGLNPVETSTDYIYNNLINFLPTQTLTSVNNKSIISKTFYPDDIDTANSLGLDNLSIIEKNAINLLKKDAQHRISEPIQTNTYEDRNNNGIAEQDELLSSQRTNYKVLGKNLVLPKTIQTSKGSGNLEDRITYHKYDNKGNPIEVSKAKGTHTYYIWGYNKQYPLAKIDNFTSAQAEVIKTLIIAAETASNADNDRTQGNTGKEGILRQALNAIRNHTTLSKTMISTYTYDPLIGVTSVTDPKGYTMYYEYDAFNRLEHVKDANGKLLSKNQYNYKN